MRILKLRFKNLNSLAGEWEIDLTNPEYASGGLFAITGPTGAGKTTVLDALCLALYRRTPRLDKISKSVNDIMTRGTADCSAEVTVETRSGTFCCHWSQRRARNKPDGELQDAKHEVSHLDTGDILASGLKDAEKLVQHLTGMTYEQFTRSILLAQGAFAAFLNETPDRRSPILEQITGTEIYSQISVHIHKRRADATNQLKMLEATLQGMRLLSEGEVQQLQASLTDIHQEHAIKQKHLEQTTDQIKWTESIATLERDIEKIKAEEKVWQASKESFAPQEYRLSRARRALELDGAHQGLCLLQNEQSRDQITFDSEHATLPLKTQQVADFGQSLKAATERVDGERSALAKAMPLLQQVRALDLKANEKEGPIKKTAQRLTQLNDQLRLTKHEANKYRSSVTSAQSKLRELTKLLQETSVDEALIQEAAGLHYQLQTLDEQQQILAQKHSAIPHGNQRLLQVKTEHETQVNLMAGQQNTLNELQQKLNAQKQSLSAILNGKDLSTWRTAAAASRERLALLLDLDKSIEAQRAAEVGGADIGERRRQLEQQRLTDETLKTAHDQSMKETERLITALEANLMLQRQIQSLEDARHQLRDGESCPLCGSLEHPYAQGNLPRLDHNEQELQQTKDVLKKTTQAASDLLVSLARLDKEIEQLSAREKDNQVAFAEATTAVTQTCERLSLPADFDIVTLPQLIENTQTDLGLAEATLVQTEQAEAEVKALAEEAQRLNDIVAESRLKLESMRHAVDQAAVALTTAQAEEAAAVQAYQHTLQICEAELTKYGISPIQLGSVKTVHSVINDRKHMREVRNAENISLDKKLEQDTNQLANLDQEVLKIGIDLEAAEGEMAELRAELEKIADQRRHLFGDKVPDVEEGLINRAVHAAELGLKTADNDHRAAENVLKAAQTKMEALSQTLMTRSAVIAAAMEQFTIGLSQQEFRDENDYLQAKLPESTRNELIAAATKLANQRADLDGSFRDRTEKLRSERERYLTEDNPPVLLARKETLSTDLTKLAHEIGALGQKLKENDEARLNHSGRLSEIEAHRCETARWDNLHLLIGSNDGKKFRNFAQGLTFERLVQHANRQLGTMSDRYVLVRSKSEDLDFSVIDSYQAGEVRTTKNLSGGESFLVSLALALGLSQMASNKTRVDSLFLDEGFGTLDPDTLETALDALAGLKHDGKLIGVISHLPDLKERIETQIRVVRRSGGRSVIEGPGCSRVDGVSATGV
ncbi:MAG: AAA family ATPase [Proteobacteria bacterium]|nr:AAA family ATPase [Pseudomonadota bacterium]